MPEPWLREAVNVALDVVDRGDKSCEVSVLVTGDETVRKLNREYRGLDEITDVLSFSPLHSGEWEGEPTEVPEGAGGPQEPDFVYPPGHAAPLGDVVISFPQAQRQALERSQPLDREMALLIVHGILHLAGHDHAEPVEETAMQAKEQAALKMIPTLDIFPSPPHSRPFKARQPSEDGV